MSRASSRQHTRRKSSTSSAQTKRAAGSRRRKRSPTPRARRISSSSCRRSSSKRSASSSFSSSSFRMELPALTVADLQQKLRAREVSPLEVLDALDARIQAVDSRIHAYLARDLTAAKTQAASVDVTLPLGGVTIAIKDVINVQGEQCTCASRI